MMYIQQKKNSNESKRFEHFSLNLQDIEFIIGTVQLQTKFGEGNTMIPVTNIEPLEYYIDSTTHECSFKCIYKCI